jgi:hypothetical protein
VGGGGGIAKPDLTSTLMETSGQLHATLPPGQEAPVPIICEVGLGPEPVWKMWISKISLAVDKNRTSAPSP